MSNNKCVKKINCEESLLIVIDMQEKIVKAMHGKLELINTVEKLITGCRLLEIPLIFTQQYTKGLGETMPVLREVATTVVDSSVKNITTASENPIQTQEPEKFTFVEKHSFSIVGEPDFVREMKRYDVKDIIVCGIEAHVCVQQSVLDLLDEGYNVFVAVDGCSSRFEQDNDWAMARMEASGAVMTTTESILFELLGDAKNPGFKEISLLVK